MTVQILRGDVRDRLRDLPDESVHCVVTSPPYWGLRDYGMTGQIGLEDTPDAFVGALVEVFREVRRVLRADGTLWLNLGDSYTGSGKGGNPEDGKQATNKGSQSIGTLYGKTGESARRAAVTNVSRRLCAEQGFAPKNLVGIPWRVAFALQAPDYLGKIRRESDRAWLAALVDGEGCITILETTSGHGSGESYPPVLQVRMCDVECIEKAAQITGYGSPSPPQEPPSQGGQRPSYQWRLHGRKAADTIAEIYPFLLIKRKQAIVAWNHQAVRDGYETKRGVKIPADALEKQILCRELAQRLNRREPVDIPSWMIEPPQPFGPGWYLRQDLIWHKPNPMPESVRDRCTKSHEYIFLLAKSERYYFDQASILEPVSGATVARLSQPTLRNKRSVWTVTTQPFKEAHFATFPPALIEPCILAGCPVGGTVLDPFGGAGTTGLVADRLQRDAILIELNPKYADMAERRIVADGPLFAQVGT